MKNKFLTYIKEKLSSEYFPMGEEQRSEGKGDMDFSSYDSLGMGDAPILFENYNSYKSAYKVRENSIFFSKTESDAHRELVRRFAEFTGNGSALMFHSGMSIIDALLEQEDAVIADELTNVSLSGKIRLCSAVKYKYRHNNMADLESQLMLAQAQRFRIIITDGLFSVDGDLARLDEIYTLAQKYSAMVMVDETYSAGLVGPHGKGCCEHFGLAGRIDIVTGSFDKMFGGVPGGFVASSPEIIEMLKHNLKYEQLLSPQQCCLILAALDYMEKGDAKREALWNNTEYFKNGLKNAGFRLKNSGPTTCTVMTYDTLLTRTLVAQLENDGITAKGFWFPIVPKKQARIRFRLSSEFSEKELDRVLVSLIEHGRAAQLI